VTSTPLFNVYNKLAYGSATRQPITDSAGDYGAGDYSRAGGSKSTIRHHATWCLTKTSYPTSR